MTKEQFKELFSTVFANLPVAIRDAIREHLSDNKIDIEIDVSDEKMISAKARMNNNDIAAVTAFDYPEKVVWVVFSECLLKATEDVASAIIAHELIHITGPTNKLDNSSVIKWWEENKETVRAKDSDKSAEPTK